MNTKPFELPEAADVYRAMEALRFRKHAFARWAAYRDTLTTFIGRYSKADTRLALFGPGYSNDIDLAVLAGRCASIDLFDLHPETVEQALEKYQLQNLKSIRTFRRDFTGIEEADYIRLTGLALRYYALGKTDADFAAVRSWLSEIYEKAFAHPVDFGTDCFDTCVAVGVHSQLNSTAAWILRYCAEQTGASLTEREDILFHDIISRTDRIVQKFTDALCRAAKGTLITGYEKNICGRVRGVEGARQTDTYLRRLGEEGTLFLSEEAEAVWPYDHSEGRAFLMRLAAFTVQTTGASA